MAGNIVKLTRHRGAYGDAHPHGAEHFPGKFRTLKGLVQGVEQKTHRKSGIADGRGFRYFEDRQFQGRFEAAGQIRKRLRGKKGLAGGFQTVPQGGNDAHTADSGARHLQFLTSCGWP